MTGEAQNSDTRSCPPSHRYATFLRARSDPRPGGPRRAPGALLAQVCACPLSFVPAQQVAQLFSLKTIFLTFGELPFYLKYRCTTFLPISCLCGFYYVNPRPFRATCSPVNCAASRSLLGMTLGLPSTPSFSSLAFPAASRVSSSRAVVFTTSLAGPLTSFPTLALLVFTYRTAGKHRCESRTLVTGKASWARGRGEKWRQQQTWPQVNDSGEPPEHGQEILKAQQTVRVWSLNPEASSARTPDHQ